jgi:glycosyltransferase involved in cell wall biosynthesis
MKFILIMCTIGRSEEPKRFLDSIAKQSYKKLKVIIVDQNKDDRISSMIESYSNEFEIQYLHSNQTGLSKARNKALPHIEEGVVAFPDDDCWYPPTLLEDLNTVFIEKPSYDGICIQRNDNEASITDNSKSIVLSKFNIWGRASSICQFSRTSTIMGTGLFDEQLGVGANTPWGAGEDTDFALRSINNGFNWVYFPTLKVFHAAPVRQVSHNDSHRIKSYARGLGKVLQKNQLPWWLITISISLSVLKSIKGLLFLNLAGARWHLAAAQGKLEGIFQAN